MPSRSFFSSSTIKILYMLQSPPNFSFAETIIPHERGLSLLQKWLTLLQRGQTPFSHIIYQSFRLFLLQLFYIHINILRYTLLLRVQFFLLHSLLGCLFALPLSCNLMCPINFMYRSLHKDWRILNVLIPESFLLTLFRPTKKEREQHPLLIRSADLHAVPYQSLFLSSV